MAASLTDRDLRRQTEVVQELLSPLEHDSVPAWGQQVVSALSEFLRSGRALLFLPTRGGIHAFASGVPAEPFREAVRATSPGANHFYDPALDRTMAAIRRRGLGAWSTPMIPEVSGIELERQPFYHEVLRPLGMAHLLALGAPSPGGGILSVGYDDPSERPFGDRTLAAFDTLRPAFRAGVRSFERFRQRAGALRHVLSDSELGLLVVGPDGEILWTNSRLDGLLEEDPAGSDLMARLLRVARAARRSRIPGRKAARPEPVRKPRDRIRTEWDTYRLAAGFLPPGTAHRDWAVVVAVRPGRIALPTVRELQEFEGLTERQAEVA
nr:hypothetical protein [Gemmatimonadota bacterium]NIR77004.1 hypothetical protein [Gemmatimonadota bacterium]NIT85533.1 hypothetical protein [Gemmatimonadota bacterium]NIU29359.1 hypothetical protein [Gemmatimonadota bacterium]NIU34419.1 hypothetical protein [Gemmatimonadota bacterium]